MLPARLKLTSSVRAYKAPLSSFTLSEAERSYSRMHVNSCFNRKCSPAARSAATGQRAMWPAYVMGAWFFLGGIANAIQLGTPMWLTVTDALGHLPVALMTGKIMART